MLFATTVSAILLVSSTLVHADSNTTVISFLLMVASGRSPDFSTLVPTVDQTLEEINMELKFNMKYKINDTEVSVEQCLYRTQIGLLQRSAMQQGLFSFITMRW